MINATKNFIPKERENHKLIFLKRYVKLCSQYSKVKTNEELVKKKWKMYHIFQSLLHKKIYLNTKTLLISWTKTVLSLYSRESISSKIACHPVIPVECYHISNVVTTYHLRNKQLRISTG